jgi:hypothetical protein
MCLPQEERNKFIEKEEEEEDVNKHYSDTESDDDGKHVFEAKSNKKKQRKPSTHAFRRLIY